VHKSDNSLPVCDPGLFHIDVQKMKMGIWIQKNTFVIPTDPPKTFQKNNFKSGKSGTDGIKKANYEGLAVPPPQYEG